MSDSRRHWRVSLAVLLTGGVLVVGTDAVTYAATGQSLILGKANKAGATTKVNNTGRGPVLDLVGGKLYPPLKVNSSRLVSNLNADKLDGKHAADLAPVTKVFSNGTFGSALTDFHQAVLPPGDYDTNLSGVIHSEAAAVGDPIDCFVIDFDKFVGEDIWPAAMVYDKRNFDNTKNASLNAVGVTHVTSTSKILYSCLATHGDLTQVVPLKASFRRLTTVQKLAGPVFTLPAP